MRVVPRRPAGSGKESAHRPRGSRPQTAAGGRRGAPLLWVGGTVALVLVTAAIIWFVVSGTHLPQPGEPITAGTALPAIPRVEVGATADGAPFIGAAGARVVIEEFGDFQCPFCGAFVRETEPKILSTYVATGKARLIWYAVTFLGPESIRAALASLCAQDQGKFWEYRELLYWNQRGENRGGFAPPRLLALAAQAHLDVPKFRACLASGGHVAALLS